MKVNNLYRKKPVVIEATQWFKNGDHPLDYEQNIDNIYTSEYRKNNDWEGDVVRYFRNPNVKDLDICRYCNKHMIYHGWIDTLEGGHIVCPGDWIITGVNGEFYSCKPDIFEKTYEKVEIEND